MRRRVFRRARKKRLDTIFIDRDGVINKDPDGWTPHSYVTTWKDFKFLPGVFQALKLLNRHEIKVVIVSNQGGVGKGHFTKAELDGVTKRMLDEINRNGGKIEEVYYCIHKKEDNCRCRKPNPGMLESAVRKYDVDPRKTFFIGDTERDVLAGQAMRMRTIFVASGKNTVEDMHKWSVKPDYIFKDLLEAAQWVVGREKRKTERALKRRDGIIKGAGEVAALEGEEGIIDEGDADDASEGTGEES